MTRCEYNGWTNYETWVVGLWFNDDQGLQSQWSKRASELLHDGATDDDQHNACSTLADEMKELVEEGNPCDEAGFYIDLMSAALSEVNWFEIAEHYVDAVAQEAEPISGPK